MVDLVDMAEAEMLAAQLKALHGVTFLPGSWDKRFVRDMHQRDPATMTENQCNQVRRLARKYRRQMPAHLVPAGTNLPKGARA